MFCGRLTRVVPFEKAYVPFDRARGQYLHAPCQRAGRNETSVPGTFSQPRQSAIYIGLVFIAILSHPGGSVPFFFGFSVPIVSWTADTLTPFANLRANSGQAAELHVDRQDMSTKK